MCCVGGCGLIVVAVVVVVVVVVVDVVELGEVRLDGACRRLKYEGPDALAAVPVGAVHVELM